VASPQVSRPWTMFEERTSSLPRGSPAPGTFWTVTVMTSRRPATPAIDPAVLERLTALLQVAAGLGTGSGVHQDARAWAQSWRRAVRARCNGRIDRLLRSTTPWRAEWALALQELSWRRENASVVSSRRALTALTTRLAKSGSRRFLMARAFAPRSLAYAKDGGRWGYREIRIRKPNGTMRVIHAPAPPLKRLQRELLHEISDDLRTRLRMLGVPIAPTVALHALSVGKADWVINLDLKDFYPSVSRAGIESGLRFLSRATSNSGRRTHGGPTSSYRHASSLHRPTVAGFLSGICTRRGVLPQGAPTSPLLASIAFAPYDRRIQRALSARFGEHVSYSRYADDLVIGLPNVAGAPPWDESSSQAVIELVRQALRRSPFDLNEAKTDQGPLGSTAICGLIPLREPDGLKIDVKPALHREMRGHLHALRTRGLHGAASRWWAEHGNAFIKRSSSRRHTGTPWRQARRLHALCAVGLAWMPSGPSSAELAKVLRDQLAESSPMSLTQVPPEHLACCAFLEHLVGQVAYLGDLSSHPSTARLSTLAANLRDQLQAIREGTSHL